MRFRFAFIIAVSLMATSLTHGQVNFPFFANAGSFTSTSTVPDAAWFWGTFNTPPIGDNAWHTLGNDNVSRTELTSQPLFVVDPGTVAGTLLHRFNQESGFDGGQLQFSVNGGAFQTIPQNLITGVTYTGQIDAGANSEIAGQWAFTGQSAGFATPDYVTTNFTLGAGASPFANGVASNFNTGDMILFRFLSVTNDTGDAGDPTWQLGELSLTNVSTVPEPTTYLFFGSLAVGGLCVAQRRRRDIRLRKTAGATSS